MLRGAWVAPLAQAFHGMFGAASFRHRRLARFRRHMVPQRIRVEDADLFLLSPGRGRNPARESLVADVRRARCVRLTTAYFRRRGVCGLALARAARSGCGCNCWFPGRVGRAAGAACGAGSVRALASRRVEIHEYQPAVLHTKRYLLDDVVYVGSANLDLRSLNINYDLLLRIEDAGLAAGARGVRG